MNLHASCRRARRALARGCAGLALALLPAWVASAAPAADAAPVAAQSPAQNAVPDGAQTAAQTAAPGAGLAASATLVYRTTAEFRLAGLPLRMSARTTTTWRLDARGYETHLHMDTVDFDQLSQGSVGPDGVLVPARYTEKRPFHDPETVRIDWSAKEIRYAGDARAAAPAPGAQDRLSLQFELARQRLRHPELFGAGSTHAIRLVGTHDVDPWTFAVGAEEQVETGRGTLRAVRCSAHRTVGAAEETIDIWLGADLQWMPVRIRMVDRHRSVIDSVLQSSEIS